MQNIITNPDLGNKITFKQIATIFIPLSEKLQNYLISKKIYLGHSLIEFFHL